MTSRKKINGEVGIDRGEREEDRVRGLGTEREIKRWGERGREKDRERVKEREG